MFPPHWHSPSGGGHEALLLLPLRHGAGMCRVAPAAAITAKWIANIVFAAVRTRTPTREEARAAAARACLRAGPLPEPCVCSSGTASGGQGGAAQAHMATLARLVAGHENANNGFLMQLQTGCLFFFLD